MNKVFLIGRLVKDPEVRQTNTGKTVASFTLAINDGKDAEGKEIVQYINCIAWEKLAEIVEKYTKKGYKLGVVGSLRNSSWDKPDGTKGYKTDVIISDLELLTSKVEAERLGQIYNEQKEDLQKTDKAKKDKENDHLEDLPEIDVDSLEVDIPF